jgi:hypothetical protein
MISLSKPDEPLSQEYRRRAEECRSKAQTFRDPKARARMLDVAAEYERKSRQAEALEGSHDAETKNGPQQ